jgi:hypothetical protein
MINTYLKTTLSYARSSLEIYRTGRPAASCLEQLERLMCPTGSSGHWAKGRRVALVADNYGRKKLVSIWEIIRGSFDLPSYIKPSFFGRARMSQNFGPKVK